MEKQSTSVEKSRLIDRLKDKTYRAAYVRASINVNLPSQIRALRLAMPMTQKEFANEAGMLQPRISAMEKPGETKFNIETLVRLAATFGVGLIIKFVSFSEMINWENRFSQDHFRVASFDNDTALACGRYGRSASRWSSLSPTPDWSFETSGRAINDPPENVNATVISPPTTAGSTATVQTFQVY